MKNVLLIGYNKPIAKLRILNFRDLFRQIRLFLTKKAMMNNQTRIVKLVVIGPKICENSHFYFQQDSNKQMLSIPTLIVFVEILHDVFWWV